MSSNPVSLSEPDAIDNVALPCAQTDLIGHSEIESQLLNEFASGRQHHAIVLGGPRGIGKATLAFRLARFILANPDPSTDIVKDARSLTLDPESPIFGKVAAGFHPNLLHLHRPWDERGKRFRTEITVDVVRRTTSFFGSTAAENTWRICIVDAADEMNINAANALLKILEEPPNRALFILIAHQPGRLLATIRSRCRIFSMRALSPTAVQQALDRMPATADTKQSDRQDAARLSGGSLRRAITLLVNDGLTIQRALSTIIAQLPAADVQVTHKFADQVARRGADDAFRLFLDGVHDHIALTVREEASRSGVDPGDLNRWAKAWEKIDDQARIALGYNLDRKQFVLDTIHTLAQASGTS